MIPLALEFYLGVIEQESGDDEDDDDDMNDDHSDEDEDESGVKIFNTKLAPEKRDFSFFVQKLHFFFFFFLSFFLSFISAVLIQ